MGSHSHSNRSSGKHLESPSVPQRLFRCLVCGAILKENQLDYEVLEGAEVPGCPQCLRWGCLRESSTNNQNASGSERQSEDQAK